MADGIMSMYLVVSAVSSNHSLLFLYLCVILSNHSIGKQQSTGWMELVVVLLCNDQRFLIFIVLFGKNKILSRKLFNFQNGHHILPNLKCAGVIHCWLFIKNKKNKKTITKHLTSGSPIRWAERFYKIGQTYLGKQLGSNYFSTLFKTTNSNVCQLRVVFYIKYNDVFLMIWTTGTTQCGTHNLRRWTLVLLA